MCRQHHGSFALVGQGQVEMLVGQGKVEMLETAVQPAQKTGLPIGLPASACTDRSC